MPQISQRTVAHMVSIFRGLYTPWDEHTLPIVSQNEMYWDLYANQFEARDLDFWKSRYDWRFNFVLPQLYDGRVFVQQVSCAVQDSRLRAGLRAQEPTPDQTAKGRDFLLRLAEYLLKKLASLPDHLAELKQTREVLVRSLELDGFSLLAGKLVPSDSAVTEQTKQTALLVKLIEESAFRNKETAIHHYHEAEELYVQQKWDPCIGESRKFFERLLRDVACEAARNRKDSDPSSSPMKDVFDYLEESGFLDKDEKAAIGATWGFLSSGSHPGIAPDHKASLAMMQALSFGQIVVLKFLDWRKCSCQGFSVK